MQFIDHNKSVDAMDIGVHGSLSTMIFSGYVPSSGLLSNMVVLFLGF